MSRLFKDFINKESIGGLLLTLATIIGLLIANSRFNLYYEHLLNIKISVAIGHHGLSKPTLLWVNEGLMSVFFFIIGLELKRECLQGHLRNPKKAILPVFAAIGGVLVPVAVYSCINGAHIGFAHGWAIPMATDIAFALGVMSLFSKYISKEMRVFLLTLAIIDDLIAIIVIAVFHTRDLSFVSVIAADLCLLGLFLLHKFKVKHLTYYFVIGILLWLSVLKSGVHATLAGVILALAIPVEGKQGEPILENLERDLSPLVTFFVLPIFAFVNSGIDFTHFTWNSVFHSISFAIALALLLGKPFGVASFTYLIQKITRIQLQMKWFDVIIIGCFSGIGFTMSLFISALSFDQNLYWLDLSRLGILIGSVLSIMLACLLVYIKIKCSKRSL